MAFHLKNLKTQKDKFFSSLTGQQLCDMVKDGEIMSYVNTIPIRRDELASIFQAIGETCDTRKQMAPGVRQKKLAPLVVQLSKIVKEYESKKVQMAANLENTLRKQKEAANLAAAAQAEANRKDAEASAKAAANAQIKNAQAAAEAAVANVSIKLSPEENSALTKELSNLKKNMNSLSARLNKAIQNSRMTRNIRAVAARRGGSRYRNSTRKARRV